MPGADHSCTKYGLYAAGLSGWKFTGPTRGSDEERECCRTVGACTALQWIMGTVVQGYRLQFKKCLPLFRGIVVSKVHPSSPPVLWEEIHSFLEKQAIRIVPMHESQCGFYSRYIVIPKKDSGSAYPGPQDIKQIPEKVQIQDADAKYCSPFDRGMGALQWT